jgi:hypothetical protein
LVCDDALKAPKVPNVVDLAQEIAETLPKPSERVNPERQSRFIRGLTQHPALKGSLLDIYAKHMYSESSPPDASAR